jgi:anaerobic selenocysteine-containing dehydrogenase
MPDDLAKSAVTERKSFCRICIGHCGVVLSLDHDKRLVGIRGDKEDTQTLGYVCFKGLQAVEAHNGAERLLHPQKRLPDGTFERIGLEQALDEIAAKMRQALDGGGPEAIAGFKGGGGFMNAGACTLINEILAALGSAKMFSTNTIDQSAKYIAANRLGIWPPGLHPFRGSEVVLMIGGNPLVSVTNFDVRNPMKRLKKAKAEGMKLLIVDPRLTETAQFADVFVQPLPGEDATIVAGMIRLIFANGWEDKEFLAANATDTERLRQAVAPYTPEYVASRADIPVEKLLQLTETFALAKRGAAITATGPDMGPHSNLAEHLVGCLNIICGRYIREGERIDNPGVLQPRFPRRCQVTPASRPWETSYKSRIGGYGILFGELPTGILADEILEPGPGRVRCLLVHGGNPASCVPDQRKMVRALSNLDLLVTIEPHMTPTAKLSHYVLPPVLQYERPDLPLWLYETNAYPDPFTRYTPAIADLPPGSELAEEGYVFWGLFKRLGIQMRSCGAEVDMSRPPTADELLAIAARHAPVPFSEIQRHESGLAISVEPQYAERGDPGPHDRFTLLPDDVFFEMEKLAGENFALPKILPNGQPATFRTAVRRHRDRFNSTGGFLSALRKRIPYNTALMNPDDLAALGIPAGDFVTVTSDAGAIRLIAEADHTIRRGVVSILHGFGDLPDQSDYLKRGVSPNLLISTDRDRETINAMPRMTAIPVAIQRAN